MKKLYYNPIELPEKIVIRSRAFGLDTEYTIEEAQEKPIYIDDLFELAVCRSFDMVAVFVIAHNEVYLRDTKNPFNKVALTGWVNLCDYKRGGGYLDDKYNGI